MRKPAELRAFLTAANEYLKRDPDKLLVFVDEGRIIATGMPTYSHEYRYTLTMVITDYNGPSDAIMLPLLAWLRVHQIDLFENPEKRDDAVKFDVEFLSHDTIDLRITTTLTERVIAVIDPVSARVNVKYAGEPTHPDLPTDPAKPSRDIYLDGSKIAVLPYPGWTPAQ